MSKRLMLFLVMAGAMLGLTTPLPGQSRTAVSAAELDAAVTTPATRRGDAVRDILKTDQARQIAGRMGVSEAEFSAKVASLDPATLNMLAAQAQVDDEALAGGNTVTIGYAALAIILLVVIILLIA